jgi:hypothetical protein
MTSPARRLRLLDVTLYERPVCFRIPFRFGAATVTHAPQAFVRARIRLADGRQADGIAAELMVPARPMSSATATITSTAWPVLPRRSNSASLPSIPTFTGATSAGTTDACAWQSVTARSRSARSSPRGLASA